MSQLAPGCGPSQCLWSHDTAPKSASNSVKLDGSTAAKGVINCSQLLSRPWQGSTYVICGATRCLSADPSHRWTVKVLDRATLRRVELFSGDSRPPGAAAGALRFLLQLGPDQVAAVGGSYGRPAHGLPRRLPLLLRISLRKLDSRAAAYGEQMSCGRLHRLGGDFDGQGRSAALAEVGCDSFGPARARSDSRSD
eukprot:4118500-Pleurochrysis_carterae.AAC.2